MILAIIILSVSVIGIVVGAIALIKKQRSTIKTLRSDLVDEQEKLRQEVIRSGEIEKQVTSLLEFNNNDSAIGKEMTEHAKILRRATSNEKVEEELKKVSTTIRDIYRAN